MLNYISPFDTPEKIQLADKLYKKYKKNITPHLINYIFNNIKNSTNCCDYFLIKLKEDNVDINKNNILNNFLPKREYYHNKDSKFFISSSEIPRLSLLLDRGFRFNETIYNYCGKSLFIAVCLSERKDIIETILPSLKGNFPESLFWDSQIKEIEPLKDKKPELYKSVMTHYQKLMLENTLSQKENKKEVKVKL